MAKETITEYEPKERTVKKIQCESCDETWENMEDVDVIAVLNARLQERSLGSWRPRRFNSNIYGSDQYRIVSDGRAEYCHSCFESLTTDSAAMEIKESEQYVDEVTRTIYTCDFCSETIGESSNNTIRTNPRIESTDDDIRTPSDPKVREHSIGDVVSTSSYRSYSAECDGSYDVCNSCVQDIIYGSQNTESSGGFIYRACCKFKNWV